MKNYQQLLLFFDIKNIFKFKTKSFHSIDVHNSEVRPIIFYLFFIDEMRDKNAYTAAYNIFIMN